jgi:hypothetical protein
MKTPPLSAREVRQLQARYRTLAKGLGKFESLSQGSVIPQSSSAWMWTRKVGGKTVSRGLSPDKAHQMKQAIANHRELEAIIAEMREITQNLILHTPETTRKAHLPKRPKPALS